MASHKYHRTTSERRQLAREIAAEDRKTLKGCVVVVEMNALRPPEKKKLEKIGAVVIERKSGYAVSFTWPPEGR